MKSYLKVDIVSPVVKTWVWLQKCLCKGDYVDACLKTVIQLGQGHNTAICEGSMNGHYGPFSVADIPLLQ